MASLDTGSRHKEYVLFCLLCYGLQGYIRTPKFDVSEKTMFLFMKKQILYYLTKILFIYFVILLKDEDMSCVRMLINMTSMVSSHLCALKKGEMHNN